MERWTLVSCLSANSVFMLNVVEIQASYVPYAEYCVNKNYESTAQ